jgi:hypothetical protein
MGLTRLLIVLASVAVLAYGNVIMYDAKLAPEECIKVNQTFQIVFNKYEKFILINLIINYVFLTNLE